MSDPKGCEQHPVANGFCVHCLRLQPEQTGVTDFLTAEEPAETHRCEEAS